MHSRLLLGPLPYRGSSYCQTPIENLILRWTPVWCLSGWQLTHFCILHNLHCQHTSLSHLCWKMSTFQEFWEFLVTPPQCWPWATSAVLTQHLLLLWKGGQALEWAAQRGVGVPDPWWCSESIWMLCWGTWFSENHWWWANGWTGWSCGSFPTLVILWFYEHGLCHFSQRCHFPTWRWCGDRTRGNGFNSKRVDLSWI